MTELLTIDDVASLLKVSKRHVYELAQERTRSGDLKANPLPCMRLGTSVRFRRTDVETWLQSLVATKKRV